jgi:glycerate kinase
MRVLISPNAFKGTLSAMEAAELVDSVLKKSSLEIDSRLVPIADGGDGTCQLLNDALGFEKVTTWILDAYGRPIEGFYGWDLVTKTAYIDVSTASGLGVLAQETKTLSLLLVLGQGF